MSLDRVLHCQGRQTELGRNRFHVSGGRLLKADPHEAVGGSSGVAGLLERDPTGAADAVLVDGAVADDLFDPPLVG